MHPLLLLTLPLPASAQGINDTQTCTQLASQLSLENVTVNFAEYVPAGTNVSTGYDGAYNTSSCGYTSQPVTVGLCRVALSVATSSRSGITLEAWLPTNWTGRFLSTGNGGIGGCIQYADLAYTVGLGFATVGANNGHNGTGGLAFLNNPGTIQDFASRSMHTGVVIGKEITKQYYGTAHTKSYYLGCSTGGRQGFKAVQSYPEDFDGVVAGAPALAFTNLTSWSAHFYTTFGTSNSSTFIPPGAPWSLIHQEILKQCDWIDGVVDGIIEDPTLCHFQPQALLCAPPSNSTNTTDCLTSEQVDALKIVFEDYYGVDGSLIFPRMQPGSEEVAQYVYYTSGPFPYSVDWFRYVVYNDSTWDPLTYNILDAQVAAEQNPFNIMTWEGDLSAFQDKGGKILHYHGLADYIITSNNSPRYYNHVSHTMDLTSDKIDEFYRFFRISGMGHCDGGDGAHSIGQNGAAVSTLDPQNNVLLRMVDWVENGNAPETVTGTKYVNDDPTQGVAFVRDHCKYPKRNVCKDPENYTKAEAWECI